MDVISNEIMINSLKSSGRVAVMVSEENEELILVDGYEHAPYSVVFDPLDGSSNIDSGVSIGTIFGIYKVVQFSYHQLRMNQMSPLRKPFFLPVENWWLQAMPCTGASHRWYFRRETVSMDTLWTR